MHRRPGLSHGYLGRPAETAARFVPDPFGAGSGHRMYRTGDLVRWAPGDVLEFLGRIDRQVKIRGFRVELGEIEAVLAAWPAVLQAVVEPWDDDADGLRHLVAYLVPAEPARPPSLADLRAVVAPALPPYMLPTRLVVLDAIPRTVHGKPDRRALLGTTTVGAEDGFFELGGNSLQATQITARIRDKFGVEIDLLEFFTEPTVRHLAELIDQAESRRQAPQASTPAAPPAAMTVGARLPASYQQAALAQACWADGDKPAYHPVRTATRLENERSFDLESGPLIRVRVYRLGPDDHVMQWVIHHLVTDGWSTGIQLDEIGTAYTAFAAGGEPDLPDLPVDPAVARSFADAFLAILAAGTADPARSCAELRRLAASRLARRPPRRRPAVNSRAESHLVALPGSDWTVWRAAVLRTAGFPAEGLRRLAAPECAKVADAYLDGLASEQELDAAFADAAQHCAEEIYSIATDDLFREAVTWQSRSVLAALAGIARGGRAPKRSSKHRERERIVARYWQRYCAKTETIGFFGPVCWVTVDPDSPAVTARPGPALVRDRQVFLEYWALAAYADRVAADSRVRPWLRPVLQPHLTLDGLSLLDPPRSPVRLAAAEAAVLARCDGRHSAAEVARLVIAGPAAGLRTEADVYLQLERLAAQGVLLWPANLPVRLDCEQILRERLAEIGDDELRDEALAGLDRLSEARDAVAAAAGDPDQLAAALGDLDKQFTAAAGAPAGHSPGQSYAGRGVCWEEAHRDLDLSVGGQVLEAIAAPLAILLQTARWVTVAIADAYLAAFGEIYDDLTAELGSPELPLGELWYAAQGLFYGTAGRPADQVAAELRSRWATLFGLSPGSTALNEAKGQRDEIRLASADLAAVVHDIFPADHPGWSEARLHSPDLQVSAASVAALNSGDFTVVLSELHVAWATNTSGVFVSRHGDQPALRAALAADLGSGRVVPLLPAQWGRNTSRLAFALDNPADVMLGFAPAPGADPDRLLPISAVHVRRDDAGSLVAAAADGRRWPLAEVFARLLSEVAVDTLKLTGSGNYNPRITLDNLVVSRRSWRLTVGECELAHTLIDRDRLLAARRWRRALGLPERVFIKVGTEVKPFFVDLTSPAYVTSAATMLRAAQTAGGPRVPVTVTEMLPDLGQAWVPDAAGDRYVSELRLQLRDPQPARTMQGTRCS